MKEVIRYCIFPYHFQMEDRSSEKLRPSNRSIEQNIIELTERFPEVDLVRVESHRLMDFVVYNDCTVYESPQVVRQMIRAWAADGRGNEVTCGDFEELGQFIEKRIKNRGV
ncbi:hypothetical protein MASR1M31_03240 [Porphyromonadaceae bacterium]